MGLGFQIGAESIELFYEAGLDYVHPSGFYLGTWGSGVSDKIYNNASMEWDFYGGYKGEIVKDLSYDVGALVYYYPSQHSGAIPGAKNADTAEIYGALTYGPATVKYSHAVTTLFGFAGSTTKSRKSSCGGSRSLSARIAAISGDQRNWFSR